MFITSMYLTQVLQYMRTDMSVGGKPALAVVLNDLATLTYPVSSIKKAITSRGYGQTTISKDFLQPGQECSVVKRGLRSKRRRCDTLYMECIDAETWAKLEQREYAVHSPCVCTFNNAM